MRAPPRGSLDVSLEARPTSGPAYRREKACLAWALANSSSNGVRLAIAQITPPYGLILFVLSALTGVPVREINREIWQFCAPLTIVLLLLILFPAITLGLPWLFGYRG